MQLRSHGPAALPGKLRHRLFCRARAARQDENRTASAARQVLRGTAVDQPANRTIPARSRDQQVDGRAVERELLDGLAVTGVRLHAAQSFGLATSLVDQA